MARLANRFRQNFPNQIARHFDKYIEYTNPVTFDPLTDIYQRAFTTDEWRSLNHLMERSIGRNCLYRNKSFSLYMPGGKGGSKYSREFVDFGFPDGVSRPAIDIEFDELPEDAQRKCEKWLKSVFAYKKLRRELRQRIEALLDRGWDKNHAWDGDRGCWRGGSTLGQGCNTVGQVNRIWPELLVFFPPDEIANARNASMKSRIPDYIKYRDERLTPEEFMCREQLYHDTDRTNPYSKEEMRFAQRKIEAINHVLTQMSLMKDVEHVSNYPDVNISQY